MKQRVSDFIADFLVNNGINNMFEVVGGGAMHLDDAFGHKEGMNVAEIKMLTAFGINKIGMKLNICW